jgi:predicted dehydrogenase
MLDTEVQSVYAEIGTFFGDGNIDDGAMLTLELKDGAFATIDPSWSRGQGYPAWGDLTLQIVGTRGVISVDAFNPSLTVFDHDTSNTEFLNTDEDMNRLMLEDFLTGIREGSPAGASAEDGLRTLEIALAAYQSGRDHQPKQVRKDSDSA